MGIPDSELSYPDSVSDILRCLICYEVLLEPRECRNCDVACCLTCVTRCMEISRACPHCKVDVAGIEELRPLNRNIRKELDKLKVKCPLQGCQWTGRLDLRASHDCVGDERDIRIRELEAELDGLRRAHVAMVAELKHQLAARKARISALEVQLALQAWL
eukprot:4802168-Amphidinium_carterae.1